ncbi:DUF1801 domain-containing protein [Longispora sp. NPDC051575]|uniref:iron chaperone n=1 Tax=Longispora sp. NPDC051575 TaxID=3154943 RepID=UPI00343416C8
MAFATVEEYIDSFPGDVRGILREIRRRIRLLVPDADEKISYQIPAFTLDGTYLVYYAGWKHHVSLYPVTTVDADLERDLAPYRSAKATVRFPLGAPVPYDLIERVVTYLVRQRAR